MRFEFTTTKLEGPGTTNCATEMSKMIPKLQNFIGAGHYPAQI